MGNAQSYLEIRCRDGMKGIINLAENGDNNIATTTLADVRTLITDQLDDDMVYTEYYFVVKGITISTKQESLIKVTDIMQQTKDAIIEIQEKQKSGTEKLLKRNIEEQQQQEDEKIKAEEKEEECFYKNSSSSSSNNKKPRCCSDEDDKFDYKTPTLQQQQQQAEKKTITETRQLFSKKFSNQNNTIITPKDNNNNDDESKEQEQNNNKGNNNNNYYNIQKKQVVKEQISNDNLNYHQQQHDNNNNKSIINIPTPVIDNNIEKRNNVLSQLVTDKNNNNNNSKINNNMLQQATNFFQSVDDHNIIEKKKQDTTNNNKHLNNKDNDKKSSTIINQTSNDNNKENNYENNQGTLSVNENKYEMDNDNVTAATDENKTNDIGSSSFRNDNKTKLVYYPDTHDNMMVDDDDDNDLILGRSSSIHDENEETELEFIDDATVSVHKNKKEKMLIAEGEISNTHREMNDVHQKHNEAMGKSCMVLNEITTILNNNPMFCSVERRMEWTTEIKKLLQNKKQPPQTMIGVLGSTGVGKSSLLNALLDEASILPTSGSRGCTAAVVELRYNEDLRKRDTTDTDSAIDVPIYKGQVEFMTLDEWNTELKILIDECSTHDEKTIYVKSPDPQRQPDAAVAWCKINQVYGHGTMERYPGKHQDHVLRILQSNTRVRQLLLSPNGITTSNNSIYVNEGNVTDDERNEVLRHGLNGIMNRKFKAKLTTFAKKFRMKINDYVYRKGSGNEPQTWPLIRKVILKGPWSVLSTGACLIDLPGVRDANAARARVAEQYLQNCNRIWIAAPIKRAVDDGTAKELLGDNFKRRLLMDGKYNTVSFICTQTDDCEATETMMDHQDVAIQLGHWDHMQDLSNQLADLDQNINDICQIEDNLNIELDEAKEEYKEQKELLQIKKAEQNEDQENDDEITLIRKQISEMKADIKSVKEKLVLNKKEKLEISNQSKHLQKQLKSICATVRNEYSKTYLQKDFRAGLEELTRGVDGEQNNNTNENSSDSTSDNDHSPIPDDFEMDVFCISSNDYLKLKQIKSKSDGPPNTFSNIEDTQIPALRAFVHDTTAKDRQSFAESFVTSTSNLLDRVKLVTADAQNIPTSQASRRCKAKFESKIQNLDQQVGMITKAFRDKAVKTIQISLRPSLINGAGKGKETAIQTVASWSSKSKRRKNDNHSNNKGLCYMTYKATVRRDGVYSSKSAGVVNMNQELCNPIEENSASDWQRIMDRQIRNHLTEAEQKVLALCKQIDNSVALAFSEIGIDSNRLKSLRTAANRNCISVIQNEFSAMKELACNAQRDLNRSLLPKIQERMKDGYMKASYQSGPGSFVKMNEAMVNHCDVAVSSMFDDMIEELLKEIDEMIKRLASMIAATSKAVSKALETVFSILWEDSQSTKNGFIDPKQQQLVRKCRDAQLPVLRNLTSIQAESFDILGMQQEELELDVVAVDSFEEQLSKGLKEAKNDGRFIDLCDSDSEDYHVESIASPPAAMKVKSEMII